MKVLVACEYSGAVRDAFLALGHDALSCDLLPTDVPGPHYQGDVRDILGDGWDLMVGHPECTYMANSGARWLYEKGTQARVEERWSAMQAGAEFFRELWEADIPKIALENPIMMTRAKEIIGRGKALHQTQVIQPWMFGHGETKATCLWLKNLPPLEPTDIVEGREQRIWKLPPTEDRWKIRSATFPGIAAAMAAQWGGVQ